MFIILQKNKRSKEEHSFDPYTLNTDKKRLKYAFYLTDFNININPTICRVGRCTRHQADGFGYRYDKSGTFIGEDVLDGRSSAPVQFQIMGQGKVSLDHTGGHLLHLRIRLNTFELGSSFCYLLCIFTGKGKSRKKTSAKQVAN